MKISATIITLNEERNIARCIEALLPVADEVIVLDAFSNDKTKEICQKYPVRFEQKEWMGYSASKNHLNSLAQFEYILSIDADEVLSPELAEDLLKLKAEDHDSTAFRVNRLTNYLGTWIYHSGWYPDWKIRLFPKEIARWEGEFVHEELAFSGEFTVRDLKGHLFHYSYHSLEDHKARADKYSALTARKHFVAGKNVSLVHPYLSGVGRFVSMYLLKKGILDGKRGFQIAWISAKSNIFKYKELRRLNAEDKY